MKVRLKLVEKTYIRDVIPYYRLATRKSHKMCGGITVIGERKTKTQMYAVGVRTVIWKKCSQHYIWLVCFRKCLFCYRICSLSLLYLAVSEACVYANGNQCDYVHPESWFFKITFFAAGCGLITWGWWNISTISSRQTWVIGHGVLGIGLILVGFFSINVGLGLSAERVSTAFGIDASAPCYSASENVRVLPIVVTKFKLGNVRGLKKGRLPNTTGDEATMIHVVRYFDPAEKDRLMAIYQREPHEIDSALEVVNATTDLMEA
jgi:hypothetical protein